MAITKRDVENIEHNSILWDSGRASVTGFAVRRQRSEARSFVLKYSVAGRVRWYTIGRFGSPWTVDAARTEAKRLLGEVASGSDPSTSKSASKSRTSPFLVSELCDRYMAEALAGTVLTRFKRPKKAATLQIDQGRILRHIKPLIGSMVVSDLDGRMVRRMIADIAAGKTAADERTKLRGRAVVTGGPTTAARVADLLSGIMAWALEEGLATHNPVHGVRRYRAEPRQRFLSDAELGRLGEVLRHSSADFHSHAATILELLVLTGCRLGEIANLRWSEIDLDNACFRLADTKTGRSMRAIGGGVVRKLTKLDRHHGSAFVFPASRGQGAYQGTKRVAPRIFETAGIEEASSHTLRHTYASVASGLGYSDATIAGLLGHAGRGVTSRYVHRPDEALRAAADAVSGRITMLMGGGKEALPLPSVAEQSPTAVGSRKLG